MTNKEAIELLKNLIGMVEDTHGEGAWMDACHITMEKRCKMNRYIDADVLKQKWLFRGKDGKPYRDEIDAMPTADVVEVVYCEDCKHKEYCSQIGV